MGEKTWKTKKENAVIFSCVSKGFICCVKLYFVLFYFAFSPKHLDVLSDLKMTNTSKILLHDLVLRYGKHPFRTHIHSQHTF